MSAAVQRRRGTAADTAAFTGLVGEITVDTTNHVAIIHDGATAGGFAMARADQSLSTQGSASVGDLFYSTGGSAAARLADVATGSVLVSGGVGAAPAWSTKLPSGMTADTQPAGDTSAKIATMAAVAAAIAALVNSSPTALDTLKELADAIGDDPNFAVTITNYVASKAAKGANADITSLSGLTTALSIAQGGTGAMDAKGARAGLGFDKATSVGDAAYTILATDRTVLLTAALTAPRTWTLPAASSMNPGSALRLVDQAGGISATNTLTVAVNGSDKVNGASSIIFSAAFTDFQLVTDGIGKWTFDVQGIARGGTGSTTAAAARSNLGAAAAGANTDITSLSALTTPLSIVQGGTGTATGRTAVADAAYTVVATDRVVAYTTLTAARTVTLPAAAAYPAGAVLTVVDESGACSATVTITLARVGSDTINGATSAVLTLPYGYLALESNGGGKWTIIDQSTASMAQQAASNVAITGGSIGGASGAFTTLSATGLVSAIGSATVPGYVQFYLTGGTRRGFVGFYDGGTNMVLAAEGGWGWRVQGAGFTVDPAATLSGAVTLGSTLGLKSYTVAALPTGSAGLMVFVSNGRKPSEAAGAGTGVIAVYSNGAWRRLSDETAVAA